MAATTLGVSTPSTSNATSYASGSFTPAQGDLLVVIVHVDGMVLTNSTLTASANGVSTFHKALDVASDASTNRHIIYVANQLVGASPSSMTVTYDCTGDTAGGAIVVVLRISGMSKTGSTAVKQSAGSDNNLNASSTPSLTFGANCLTGNVVLAAVANNNNPATLGGPTNYTEQTDTGFATPTTGEEVVSRDSGETGTTLTWANTSTRGSVIGVELDASAAGQTGVVSASLGGTMSATGVPRTSGQTTSSFGFTATASGQPRTFGQTTSSFGFTATASGTTVERGSVSASFGFTAVAVGDVNKVGQVSASFGFTTTSSGTRRRPGVVSASFGGTLAASGTPRKLGAETAPFGGTFSASGVDRALGATTVFFGFTSTADGDKEVFGVVVASFGGTIAATGFAGTPPVTGQVSAAFGGTLTASGVDRALGSAVVSWGGTLSATGLDRALGAAVVSFGAALQATGTRRRPGLALVTFGGSISADGAPVKLGQVVVLFGFESSALGFTVLPYVPAIRPRTRTVSPAGTRVRTISPAPGIASTIDASGTAETVEDL